MAAAAHDAKFAADHGIPQRVAREFVRADAKEAARRKDTLADLMSDASRQRRK